MPIPVVSDSCEVESQKVESSNRPLDQDVDDYSPRDDSHSPQEDNVNAFDLANDLEKAVDNNQMTSNLDELENLKFGAKNHVNEGS
jgi:hypothetical protein